MNIKKLAASLMMLSLCTVGVENVSAAAAPMATPPERLINDLDTLPDDAPEKQLYNELYRNKRTRLLDNATYSPKGITSLKKYLGYALQENPNLMNDIREATPMRANAIMARMASLISAKYHNNARDKMESVRNVLNISNACLDALCNAIQAINVDSRRDVLLASFERAIQQMSALAIGEGGSLTAEFDRYWKAKKTAHGNTKEVVSQHILKLCEAADALTVLVASIAEKATTPEHMELFHAMYDSMCEVGIGDEIMNTAEGLCPGFTEQYDNWLRQTGKQRPIPKSA